MNSPPDSAALPFTAATATREQERGSPEDTPLGLVELLLRSPGAFLERLSGRPLLGVVRALLATIAVGGGLFGVVVGTHRGGVQVLYCAIKLPLVLLVTLVVCVPSFVAATRALGTRIPPREVIALSLGACARCALVLAGLAPVVWLLEGVLTYHSVALCITAAATLAGVSAASLLFRGLRSAPGQGALAGLLFVAVYGVVGAQTAWLARPFLVRPRTEHVPFLRPLEGDLLGSVRSSARSAAGIYDRADGSWLGSGADLRAHPHPAAPRDDQGEEQDP